MHTEIARLDLHLRRRGLIGYTVGLALYALVVVAMYPAFKHSHSLDTFVRTDKTAAALFGVSGSLSSSGGWLNGNLYANFFPLIALLMTVGYGAAAIAGQDEDGTLCLTATLPVNRRTIVLQKGAAMALQALLLSGAVALCVIVGRSFQLTIPAGHALTTSAAVVLMAVDFGLFTMTLGALTGSRTTAVGIVTTLAAGSYLISSLSPVIAVIRPARFASLFYWSVGNDQISRGVSVADYAVLSVAALAALSAAIVAFSRQDLR